MAMGLLLVKGAGLHAGGRGSFVRLKDSSRLLRLVWWRRAPPNQRLAGLWRQVRQRLSSADCQEISKGLVELGLRETRHSWKMVSTRRQASAGQMCTEKGRIG